MVTAIIFLLGLIGTLLVAFNGKQESFLNVFLLGIGIMLISLSGYIRGIAFVSSKCI